MNIAPAAAKGWLPIRILLDREPAVVSEGTVRWLEVADDPLAEPFLEQTIGKLRQAMPPAREAETGLDAVLRLGARLPKVRPAGFIFHISRCGSTLVANALKSAGGVVVASEPLDMSALLLPSSGGIGPSLAERWDRQRRELLECLFSLHAHYLGDTRRLVVKFASVNTLCMPLARAWWPEVPAAVVVRDPTEVLVANLAGQGWMDLKQNPPRAQQFLGWPDLPESLAEMTAEEFGARVIGEFLDRAYTAMDANCMLVDYENLTPDRVREIGRFFGIELPDGRSLFDVHAKDPAQRSPFRDDRARKRQAATPALRAAVQRWSMVRYFDLRAW